MWTGNGAEGSGWWHDPAQTTHRRQALLRQGWWQGHLSLHWGTKWAWAVWPGHQQQWQWQENVSPSFQMSPAASQTAQLHNWWIWVVTLVCKSTGWWIPPFYPSSCDWTKGWVLPMLWAFSLFIFICLFLFVCFGVIPAQLTEFCAFCVPKLTCLCLCHSNFYSFTWFGVGRISFYLSAHGGSSGKTLPYLFIF